MVLAKRLPIFVLLCLSLAALMGAPAQAGKLTDAVKARDVALVMSLLAAGEDPQEKVRSDYPLNGAAIFGPTETVALLLDAGADIERPGRDGLHPLHNAAGMGNSDIVALLLREGAAVDAKDKLGRTSLIYFAATAAANIETARLLLGAGADPNIEDMERWTALNYAARYAGNVELGKLLIARGADINHGKDNGETPVGSATFHMHYEFAKMLIEAGADVNQVDSNGRSPLSQVTDEAMRQLLIKAGAN